MLLNILFFALSVVVSGSFVALLCMSGEFEDFIRPLDSKKFMVPEVYGVGFLLLKWSKYDYQSRGALQLRERASILFGERYADYYMRVFLAQRISLTYLIAVIMVGFCAMMKNEDKLLVLAFSIVVCATIFFYFVTLPASMIKKRNQQFLNEFPNVVSTIALLVNSGMVLREAWREVSQMHDSEFYLQMRQVNEEIDNGVAEIDAFYRFSHRCANPEIKKFTSLIVQGIEKGSKDLTHSLKNQTDELWMLKRQITIRRGELASSKLLMPMMVMFIGVLVMIMGPMMSNLGI